MDDIIKRNAVKIYGSGSTTMLFAHGYGLDQRTWRLLVPEFSKKYKVVVFDYTGSGESDRSANTEARYSSLEGYMLDILEICETLQLKDVIFVGHSISSMIGLLAAIQQPNYFQQLIFIAPSPHFLNEPETGYLGGFDRQDVLELLKAMDRDYYQWSKDTIPHVINNPSQTEFNQEILEAFMNADAVLAKRFPVATFFSDNRKHLLKLNKPCLILQCSNDFMAPLEVGDYLHAHLQKSTLRILKSKGHFPQITASEEVISLMNEYLQGKTLV